MSKIKREDLEALENEVESWDLLDCVDNIDHARTYLGDGENWAPPQIRTDMLNLHGLAMSVINHGDTSQAKEMFYLAFDLQGQIFNLMEHLEKVQETLTKITDSAPESLD